MRLALIGKGVPDSCITMDFAGFRTLDSVVRCQKVFGQTKFTIISQQFHNQRAVFLARQKGLDAIGYNAKDVHKSLALRTKVREPLARFKAVLDILFNKKPKFLGEPVKIKV
jgi:SanA protein